MPFTLPPLTNGERSKITECLETIGSATDASIVMLFVVRDGLLENVVIGDSRENLAFANCLNKVCMQSIAKHFQAQDPGQN